MFAGREQRVTPVERDADLDGREPAVPAKDNAADGTRHAAAFENEFCDGRDAAFLRLRHSPIKLISPWAKA